MSYKKLLHQRADLRDRLAALHAKVASGKATKEDDAAANDIQGKIETCSAQIDRMESDFNDGRPLPPARFGDGPSGSRSAGSTDDGGFKGGVGEFMQALFRKSKGEGFDPRLAPLQVKAAAINEGLPSQGGFAVPEEFVYKAFTEDLQDTVLLQLCDRVEMKSNKLNVPVYQDDNHSATSPFGIAWSMIPESGSFGDAQTLPFRKLGLEARKAGALFSASNEWLGDADPAMRDRLDAIFRASLRWYCESKLWNGIGAGMPLGALVGPGSVSIPKETGQLADTILTENVLKMWARLRPGSHSRAVWAANQTAFPMLGSLTVGVGTAGIVTSLLQTNGPGAGIAGAPATAILGRPLYLSEHLPAVGDAGDLVLLDPLLYLLGDRKQIVMDASPHVRFQYDETTFRVSARFDGQPALNSVLTPAHGDTLGWLTKISDRA